METLKQVVKMPIFWVSAVAVGAAVYFWRKCRRGGYRR